MKITHKSKLVHFLPFIDLIEKDSEKALKEQATKYFLPNGFWYISLGSFLNAINGNFDGLFGKEFKMQKATVFEYYLIAAFKDFVDDFTTALNNLSLKPTIEEAQAQTILPKVELTEGFLVYAMKTFGYKSSREAEECILMDFLMRKKDDFINQQFQRNLAKIQERKFAKK